MPYFSIILRGAYRETSGNRVRECKPATLLFHPEGELHADQFHQGYCRVFSFEIGAQWLARARQCSVELVGPIQFPTGPAVWLATKLYRELYAADDASSLVVEGLLLEILAEISRKRSRTGARQPPRWLKDARDLLLANFSESLSLDAVAKTVEIHPVHLSREFRRFYHHSIGEYVRKLRIEFACNQIASSDRPFFEIAAAAGFADHGHFTRNFKRFTSLTPSQYRKNFRSR
jgi:AraC family transcriptional regulator